MAKRKHSRKRAPRKRAPQKRMSHKKKRASRKRKTQKGGLISHRSSSGGPLLWFTKQLAKYRK